VRQETANRQSVGHQESLNARRLSCDDFASDLSASRLCHYTDANLLATMSADELASLYQAVMTDLLDRHCPLITARHCAKLSTPWFDFDCRQARRKTRAAERRYWITRTEDHKKSWAAELKTLHSLYQHKCDNF